jgi:hypothetical protein
VLLIMKYLSCAIALALMASCAYDDDELLDDDLIVEEGAQGDDGAPLRILEEGGIEAPPAAPAEPNALICSATLRTVHRNGNCASAGSLYNTAQSICNSTGWPVVSGGFSSYCGTVYGTDYYRYLRFQCCVWN